MSFSLISNIVRGEWLMDRDYTMANLPLVARLLKGENVHLIPTNPNSHIVENQPSTRANMYSVSSGSFARVTDSHGYPSDKGQNMVAMHTHTGPILHHSEECGAQGSDDLMMQILLADSNPEVIAHVFKLGTPGGMVQGTPEFSEALASLDKPFYTYADGILCSAGMWMAARSTAIYASSNLTRIGSIGTAFSMLNMTQHLKDQGIEEIYFNATGSPDKNSFYEQILEGNYEPYRTNVLDPINNEFHSAIKSGRPNITKDQLTGSVYFAKDVVGSLIDGIASLPQVMSLAYSQGLNQKQTRT